MQPKKNTNTNSRPNRAVWTVSVNCAHWRGSTLAIYKTVLIIFPLNLQTITITLDVVKWRRGGGCKRRVVVLSSWLTNLACFFCNFVYSKLQGIQVILSFFVPSRLWYKTHIVVSQEGIFYVCMLIVLSIHIQFTSFIAFRLFVWLAVWMVCYCTYFQLPVSTQIIWHIVTLIDAGFLYLCVFFSVSCK